MKPILFNEDMVRALLSGQKTVTRRVVRDAPAFEDAYPYDSWFGEWWFIRKSNSRCYRVRNPYKKGDILYVRETFAKISDWTAADPETGLPDVYIYKADWEGQEHPKWRPSIHMPKEAARIFLRVTGVRVERLRDKTEEQAMAEGAKYTDFGMYTPSWRASLDGGKTWHRANPQHHPGYHFKDVDRPDQCFEFARIAFANYWGKTIKAADRAKFGWDANPWVHVIEFERISKEEVYKSK